MSNPVTAIYKVEADLEKVLKSLKHSYVDGHEWSLIPGQESVEIFGAINDISWSLTLSAYPIGPKLNQRIPYELFVGEPGLNDNYEYKGTARNLRHVTRSVIRKLRRLEYQ